MSSASPGYEQCTPPLPPLQSTKPLPVRVTSVCLRPEIFAEMFAETFAEIFAEVFAEIFAEIFAEMCGRLGVLTSGARLGDNLGAISANISESTATGRRRRE